MQSVSGCEYSQSDLIGHGAFALVFRGRKKKVILMTGWVNLGTQCIVCMTLMLLLEIRSLLAEFA